MLTISLAVVTLGMLNEVCGEKMVSLSAGTAMALIKHLKNITVCS